MLRLFSWLRRRRKLSRLQFVLYTRAGCCLCTDAAELLRREQCRYRFSLTTVDIAADAQLTARYGTTIPVVVVDGKERFRGIVNAVLLQRLLEGEAAQQRNNHGGENHDAVSK